MHHQDRHDRGHLAERLVEQRVEMGRVDERDEDEDPDGDERDDDRRELPLRGQHLDQPADVHPRADVLRDLVEHLGRVAACLALDEREHGDLVDVGVLHALRGHLERLVERDPELLVGDDAA